MDMRKVTCTCGETYFKSEVCKDCGLCADCCECEENDGVGDCPYYDEDPRADFWYAWRAADRRREARLFYEE